MTPNIQSTLALLGRKAKDRVTGLSGVITSVCFDLYGCVQAIVHPGLDKEGKPAEQHWFDVSRLQISPGDPVLQPPAFASNDKGPAEKPRMLKP